MNRLEEINQRLSAIANEIETRGAAITADELTALETESNALMEERTRLNQEVETRTRILNNITGGQGTQRRSFAPTPTPNGGNSNAEHQEQRDGSGSREYRQAFMDYVLRNTEIPVEIRASAGTTLGDVGAVIPVTIMDRVVEKIEKYGHILELVTKTNIKGGVSVPVSSVKPVAKWTTENQTVEKQKKEIKKEASISFAYYKLRCVVGVSFEADHTTLEIFERTLVANITEAMTKAIETAIINGDGNDKPKGILASTPNAKQIVDSVFPSYADLVAAEGALPEAYEGTAVYCMSKKTFMQYHGLVDEQKRPLANIIYGSGSKPERYLLGRKVICTDDVTSYNAEAAIGTKFAFLFDFSDYMLNTNFQSGIRKYTDEDTDELVNKAIMLVDGKPISVDSLVVIRKAAAAKNSAPKETV